MNSMVIGVSAGAVSVVWSKPAVTLDAPSSVTPLGPPLGGGGAGVALAARLCLLGCDPGVEVGPARRRATVKYISLWPSAAELGALAAVRAGLREVISNSLMRPGMASRL